MKDANLPFSGKISFIKTEMYWPVNHMVATKENTLNCNSCHQRENSRLAGLNDFYMPGRDYSKIVEVGGVWMLILTLLGVLTHGVIRIVLAAKAGKGNK
jgi:hypothetical protein